MMYIVWLQEWYESAVSLNGTLAGRPRLERILLLNVASIIVGFAFVFYFTFSLPHMLLVSSVAMISVQAMGFTATIALKMPLMKNIVSVQMLCISLGLLGYDTTSRGYGQTVWPFFIIVIDLALVLRLPKWLTNALVVLVVAWLLLCSMESHFRFGLYDIPGTPSQSTRSTTILPQCEGLTLPCPQSASNSVYLTFIGILVFMCDFIATRGFADEAEREQASMAHTIDVVETIAQLLAGYDVDTVATMLEEMEGRLPAKMHSALQHLEQNLRVYRPYLPKSCLPSYVELDEFIERDHRSELQISMVRTGSGSTHQSSLAKSQVDLAAMSHRRLAFKHLNASMLVLNAHNAIDEVQDDMRLYAAMFDALLSATVVAVEARRGLVDMFVGDRILASFNTSRTCGVHASAAASAAKRIWTAVMATSHIGKLDIDIGIATGPVACGDLGCLEMRRFSVLGALPFLATGMERAARILGLDIVCNLSLQRDAEHEHVLLLVPRLVNLVKATPHGHMTVTTSTMDSGRGSRGQPIYELLPQDDDEAAEPATEWLYEIGRGAAEWAPYNAAVRAYLEGMPAEAAAQTGADLKERVAASLHQLGCRDPLLVYL